MFIIHLSRLTKNPFPVVGPRDDVVVGNDAVRSMCGVKGALDLNISGPSLLVYSLFHHVLYYIYDVLVQWCLKCQSRYKTRDLNS